MKTLYVSSDHVDINIDVKIYFGNQSSVWDRERGNMLNPTRYALNIMWKRNVIYIYIFT